MQAVADHGVARRDPAEASSLVDLQEVTDSYPGGTASRSPAWIEAPDRPLISLI